MREKLKASELFAAGIYETYMASVLDDYKVNREIKRQIELYLERIPRAMEEGLGLLLIGGSNSGKTLLAHVVAKRFMAHERSVRVTTLRDLTDIYMNDWRTAKYQDQETDDAGNPAPTRFEALRDVDCMVFDDIGKELSNEGVKMCFDNTLRYRCARRKVTIITSNAEVPDLIRHYGEPVGGLFDRNFVVIECPDAPKFVEKMKAKNRSIIEEGA